MAVADTAIGAATATATGATDIQAVGAVMAAGVAADTLGTGWVAATTGAVAEDTGVRIERPGYTPCQLKKPELSPDACPRTGLDSSRWQDVDG